MYNVSFKIILATHLMEFRDKFLKLNILYFLKPKYIHIF